ncbi:hypothetical protein FOPG_16305 [Fusarium oxysporum f. sp. conglutinans race 2 54008]|uniref:Uncharacterized protein n=1 Tax=Fusarium oxysporum f. sp. conglutinans race 2 54008 TaxID=1089457 RepID=X0H6N1_FUSOX|nr:hypothetical protein FOPG_16305 [Fusarium oxysporum f. sp. conglutinans race 2 54008]
MASSSLSSSSLPLRISLRRSTSRPKHPRVRFSYFAKSRNLGIQRPPTKKPSSPNSSLRK